MAPGLAFISISEEAWELQKTCKTPRFYFDLLSMYKNRETNPLEVSLDIIKQLENKN